MRYHSLPIIIFAAGCSLMASAVAQAAVETWVSGTGTDSGTCPIAAPCRTFAYAHSQTSNNGAINVLSSGNFGPLTITKHLSIVARGVEAVINTAAGGAGITVNAGPAAIVSLRGLTIDMRGLANRGILFTNGAALHVQDCVIRRTSEGLRFAPNSSGNKELYVSDSVFESNELSGITVRPTGGGNAKAVINRVRVENGVSDGIVFSQTTLGIVEEAIVRDSVIAGNGAVGIKAVDTRGVQLRAVVEGTSVVNNGTGIMASGRVIIFVLRSVLVGNPTALTKLQGPSNDTGIIFSFGNNIRIGNGTFDGAFSPE